MTPIALRLRIILLIGSLGLACSGWALADPPSRVARMAYTQGAISFSPGGEQDWVQATVNRPLTTGDRVWADSGSRAELQLGDVAIRIGASTSLTLLNLGDRFAQLQLTQGTLNLRVRRLDRDESFEVDTPNLAFSIRRPGSYRIEVDADGSSTSVTVRDGQAEVADEGRAFLIDAGQANRFYGTGLNDYDRVALSAPDDFDRWSSDRDRRWDDSPSARYVSRDLIGYEDLDDNGTWSNISGYGNVWTPSRVGSDWAPYRDGHWAWVEPWGWTWVDDAPWGFAPSHYGRWAHIHGNWGWIPGPVAARPVYAPALVAFVGGSNFQIAISSGNVGAVGWFPLGPREVYRPSYRVSRDYFGRVNTSGTVVNTTNITNIYNTTIVNNNTNVTNISKVVYVNQQVPGAVVAVPRTAFVQSQPVAREAVHLSREAIAGSAVVAVAAVAPVRNSVLGAAEAPKVRPPQAVWERPVVAKRAPPSAPVSFAERQGTLDTAPGRPFDAAAIGKPRAPVATTQIKVVQAPAAVALPSRPVGAAGSRPERNSPGMAAPVRAPAEAVAPPVTDAPQRPTAAPDPRTPRAPMVQPRRLNGPNQEPGRAEPPPITAPPRTADYAEPAPAAAPKPAREVSVPPMPVDAPSPRNARGRIPNDERSPRPAEALQPPPERARAPVAEPSAREPAAPPPVPAPPNRVARPPQADRPLAPPPLANEVREAVKRPPVAMPRAAEAAPPPAVRREPDAVVPTRPPSPQRGGREEPRAMQPIPEPPRAIDKRETSGEPRKVEERRKADEPRKRNEGEPGRNP